MSPLPSSHPFNVVFFNLCIILGAFVPTLLKVIVAFPDYSDQVALVNDIGRYFLGKFERIRSDIDAIDVALDQCSCDAIPQDQN